MNLNIYDFLMGVIISIVLLFFVLFAAPLGQEGPSRGPPAPPRSWGSAPRPRLGYGPRLDYLFRSLATLVTRTNRIARGNYRADYEWRALIGCLLEYMALPQKVIATTYECGT